MVAEPACTSVADYQLNRIVSRVYLSIISAISSGGTSHDYWSLFDASTDTDMDSRELENRLEPNQLLWSTTTYQPQGELHDVC